MLCHLISAIWSVGLSAYAAQMLLHSGALFNVSKSAKQVGTFIKTSWGVSCNLAKPCNEYDE